MEGTPLLRLFLPRPGFTRYLMQRSHINRLGHRTLQINPDLIVGKTEEHLIATGEFAGVLHESVVAAFEDLADRAAKSGFDLHIISGFRSFERQLTIWNAKARGARLVLDDEDNSVDITALPDLDKIRAIMRFSAIPGGSRHHWGTDMDVYDASALDDGCQVQLTYSETTGDGPLANLHRWLDLNLPKTDFYRPYERDTGGVSVEPWHLSYRPLAEKYAAVLSTKMLIESWQGVEMELMDSIKANIDALFDRFIQTEWQ